MNITAVPLSIFNITITHCAHVILQGCMTMQDLKIDNEGPLLKLLFVIPAKAGIQGTLLAT
jgi:hypothetical protein